jgi:hypothetical protein
VHLPLLVRQQPETNAPPLHRSAPPVTISVRTVHRHPRLNCAIANPPLAASFNNRAASTRSFPVPSPRLHILASMHSTCDVCLPGVPLWFSTFRALTRRLQLNQALAADPWPHAVHIPGIAPSTSASPPHTWQIKEGWTGSCISLSSPFVETVVLVLAPSAGLRPCFPSAVFYLACSSVHSFLWSLVSNAPSGTLSKIDPPNAPQHTVIPHISLLLSLNSSCLILHIPLGL